MERGFGPDGWGHLGVLSPTEAVIFSAVDSFSSKALVHLFFSFRVVHFQDGESGR